MSLSRLVELTDIISVSPADQETTDDYVDVSGSKLNSINKKRIAFTVKNTDGVNAIKYKVLASIDDSSYVEVQAEAILAATAIGSYTASYEESGYKYFKVQIKASVGSSQGDAQVRGYAK